MKKHIAEDLPARKFPQASLSKGSDRDRESNDRDREGGQEKTPEKRVRQSVYDIKYRARRENIPLRSAYTQYMQNSSMSEQEKSMVREKLFGKGGIVKETYLEGVSELASSSVAKALYNVFVEPKSEDVNYEQLKNELEEESNFNKGNKKYKVRVVDKSGTSYVRYATREKINQLRSNPNIESVEMTEYGEPYEGEKKRGERTAAATAGKDWDGDGKKESPAKEYRGVVHNAIQKRRGGTPDGKDTSSVKEEYLGEVTDESTIDVKRGKKNKIVVHHKSDNGNGMSESSSYSKFLGLLNEKEMTETEKKKEKKLKSKYDDSEMKKNMIDQYGKEKGTQIYFATIRKQAMKEENCESGDKSGEDDPRSMPTKVRNFKNKLRAMGLKMSYEPEGEVLDERRREDKGKPRSERNPAIEAIKKSPEGRGLMTRGGRIRAKHEAERGVSKGDRPSEKEETTADRLAAKKQRQAAQVASREREEREEDRRRRLG
jgi:hypothetical protein